ncbi:MAG: hypothetical protein IT310_10650 [Anaerolineales bacterium]|nr:hypothetical protein [Anaerolineales bacterium]
MSASLGLFRLQQVDSQIDRTNLQLEKIRKTLENDAELKRALTLVETAQKEARTAGLNLKQAEAEVQAQKIKIEQTEASLYSGKVHNPKELQDLQKESASLKKHLAALEERELGALVKVEEAESGLSLARSGLDLIQSKLNDDHKTLFAERSKLSTELERLGQERAASEQPIEPSLLTIYNDLRKQKRGVAVTEFSDNSCASCGAALTAALQQNAKSAKQLAQCPSCGRILYAS